MKFYDIDNALQEAINTADKPVRLKVEIESCNDYLHKVFEQDIIEAKFYGLKEATGGISARGELTLDNYHGAYSFSDVKSGSKVIISFSLGEGLVYFQRFIFFIDDKGVQDIKGNGRKRSVFISLQDLSAKLRKSDEAKDWSSPVTFVYSVVYDKTIPNKSLVHGIAKRAGLKAEDIDCATIPVIIPFVVLQNNVWSELSSLATAYRCHLECAPEKPLVFAHSPYQSEPLAENKYSHTFYSEDIFYLKKIERADYYRNTVRLKVNMPVTLEKQEIWRYNEQPVFYDDKLQPYYPFKAPLEREIEIRKYEAKYMIIDAEGRERDVIFADQIDSKKEAENRLDYDSGSFFYSHYDTFSNYDKAIVTLKKENDGDLYTASIHGRPIVYDINRSCFLGDEKEIADNGTVALNVTGSYFSDDKVPDKLSGTLQGEPQYKDWVKRELAQRVQRKNEFTVKTHRALFHARVGAQVKIKTRNDEYSGTISAFSFLYKRDTAFIAEFKSLS